MTVQKCTVFGIFSISLLFFNVQQLSLMFSLPAEGSLHSSDSVSDSSPPSAVVQTGVPTQVVQQVQTAQQVNKYSLNSPEESHPHTV